MGVTAMFPPSQVHDWLQRTTGTDGTTIRLTSSKAAGHTFTLSQQEDELLECYFCHVRAEATKGLTSGQGRFFVDCGGNPLNNLYSDLQHLIKKYLPQEPGAAVDETPSSSETPSTSTGPASLPTPPVTVGIQWDRFLEAFPVSLHSVAQSKRLCVGAGFTAYRPVYRTWRNVQLLERTSYILSQTMGRQATQPTEEAVRRALTKERWVSNRDVRKSTSEKAWSFSRWLLILIILTTALSKYGDFPSLSQDKV
ncbi:uncharacterized protein [Pseudochaenichthys georgianus]|uniref:uncharacterized protein n=1 Tax=Pseudochaenichthys georgianus TaxID=52239 RepID=UPI0039C3DA16